MIGYISDNLLIPILDFFYGLVPSYGLAIVALTIVIRDRSLSPQQRIDPQRSAHAHRPACDPETAG